MNWLSLLLLPLRLQFIGYMVGLTAVTGNGSFVGLLMIPVALLFTTLLIVIGLVACLKLRRDAPVGRYLAIQLLLAFAPAVLAIVLRAIEKAAAEKKK